MSSPAAEEVQEDAGMGMGMGGGSENNKDDDEEGHGGARVSAAAAAEGSDDAEGCKGRPTPTCCVCMEPWSCSGAHRICCIPCGHVYGRSCLERWHRRCGNTSAKCPQCGRRFKLEHITNLYAPGNVWDGCCRAQEVKAIYDSKMAEVVAEIKLLAARQSELQSKIDCIHGMIETNKEQLTQNLVLVKEQMKNMVEVGGAKPLDLIQLMEQMCNKLLVPEPPLADG